MLWEIEDNVLYRYNGDPDIEEITLPDDVDLISWEMLAKSFHHLKIVHIPKKVPCISAEFFHGASELTHIFMHPENWYYADVDGVLIDKENNLVLYYPPGRVGEYTTPAGISTIGSKYEAAFYHADHLTILTFPEGVETINKSAVCCCPNLTEVHIPASCTSIAEDAFTECYAIRNFTIALDNPVYYSKGCKIFRKDDDALVLEIVDYQALQAKAEQECIADLLANHADEYGVYWEIHDGVAVNCILPDGLTELHVPEGVTGFDSYALKGCSKIETLILPQTFKNLDIFALSN